MIPAESSAVERVRKDDLDLLRVRTPHGVALIAEQGAQLLSYQPHGQPPVVWLSEQARFERGESVRGGIPVCWPWFGDLDRNPAAVQACAGSGLGATPKHGFARTLDWVCAEPTLEADGVTLLFKLDLSHGHAGWNGAAQLSLRIRLAEVLTVELGVTNESDAALTLSQALHTYFAVSDVRQVRVEGVDGARFVDTLDGWTTKTQSGDLHITAETDRLYLGIDRTLSIHDPGWSRRIDIQTSHSASAVIWNPWIDKAARLSQFADDAWQRMLCIETARVWDDLVQVAPGDTAYMAVHIQAVPLPA